MLGQRMSVNVGVEETKRKVDGGSKEYKATTEFVVEGPMLIRGGGRNRIRRVEPMRMVL